MLLLSFHLIVAIVIYLAAMPLAARLAMLVTISSSLFYYLLRDILLLLPNSCHEIRFDRNSVSVVTRNGTLIRGRAANNTVVNPFFVLLRIRSEERRRPVSFIIFPDALNAGVFRELCVRLKFACNPSELKNHIKADKAAP